MLSRKSYNLVVEDAVEVKSGDSEDGFLQHGITYSAKLIGSTEVPRPSSRVEIVSAMRSIRYEFKEKRIKKTKVQLAVSTSGVYISKQRKKILFQQRRLHIDDSRKLLFHHPVHRIFYVSHDSQDLKIFSYIACDNNGVFKCHVFKAYRRSTAVQIVRTVGRAFDICNHLAQQQQHTDQVDDRNVLSAAAAAAVDKPVVSAPSPIISDVLPTIDESTKSNTVDNLVALHSAPPSSRSMYSSTSLFEAGSMVANTPVGVYRHHLRTVREKLRLEVAKSQHLTAELQLARDELKAETDARVDMQTRAEQLIEQNRQLLNHIKELVVIVSCVTGQTGEQLTDDTFTAEEELLLPKLAEYFQSLCSKMMTSVTDTAAAAAAAAGDGDDGGHLAQEASPDSGHREMSAYSLSLGTHTPSDLSWYSAPVSFNSTSGPTMQSPSLSVKI